MAGGVEAVTTGIGFTVTVTCVVAVQPSVLPVTVYVVVEVGLAVTVEPMLALKLVAGLHEYVLAPLAVRVVNCPVQIGEGVATLITGIGFTVTVTCAVAVQPSASPVTV